MTIFPDSLALPFPAAVSLYGWRTSRGQGYFHESLKTQTLFKDDLLTIIDLVILKEIFRTVSS